MRINTTKSLQAKPFTHVILDKVFTLSAKLFADCCSVHPCTHCQSTLHPHITTPHSKHTASSFSNSSGCAHRASAGKTARCKTLTVRVRTDTQHVDENGHVAHLVKPRLLRHNTLHGRKRRRGVSVQPRRDRRVHVVPQTFTAPPWPQQRHLKIVNMVCPC